MRGVRGRSGLSVLIVCLACTIAPAPEAAPDIGSIDALPPPGYGTLRQDEVSISLVSNSLQIMMTPLDEGVIVVTAPDTYERLSSMASAHRDQVAPGSRLFLVSFYSDQADIRFIPEDIQLISRGFRVRPALIEPVTPGWGQRRVAQRRTEMAVYAFPPDLAMEQDLTLVYGLDQSRAWSGILPRIQAERARARARAGTIGSDVAALGTAHRGDPSDQVSRPYFEIFRYSVRSPMPNNSAAFLRFPST